MSVDLADAKGKLTVEWLDPVSGKTTSRGQADAGGKRTFASPNPGRRGALAAAEFPRTLLLRSEHGKH